MYFWWITQNPKRLFSLLFHASICTYLANVFAICWLFWILACDTQRLWITVNSSETTSVFHIHNWEKGILFMVCNPFLSVKTWDQLWVLELALVTGRCSSLANFHLWLWWFEGQVGCFYTNGKISSASIYVPQTNIRTTAGIFKYETGIRIFRCMVVWHCQPWTDGAWQGLEEGIAGRAMCCPLLGTVCGH